MIQRIDVSSLLLVLSGVPRCRAHRERITSPRTLTGSYKTLTKMFQNLTPQQWIFHFYVNRKQQGPVLPQVMCIQPSLTAQQPPLLFMNTLSTVLASPLPMLRVVHCHPNSSFTYASPTVPWLLFPSMISLLRQFLYSLTYRITTVPSFLNILLISLTFSPSFKYIVPHNPPPCLRCHPLLSLWLLGNYLL